MDYVNMYKDIKSEILNSVWKESILWFSIEILKTTLASNDTIYPSTTKEEKKYVFILCEVCTVSAEKIIQLSGK